MASVGFVGLGAMGLQMATRLLKHLQQQNQTLVVFNRTAEKCQELVAAGAKRADSLEEVGRTCDVVFTMLADDAAVLGTFEQLLRGADQRGRHSVAREGDGEQQPQIFVDCSTVHPDTTAKVRAQVQQQDSARLYAAAPGWGRPDAVANGMLYFCLGGPQQARDALKPLLLGIGRGFMEIGDDATKAHTMKLIGNFFIISAIETISEAVTLADKAEIPRDNVMDFINNLLPVPAFKGYGGLIVSDGYMTAKPGFTVTLGMKDVGHMKSVAEKVQAPLPIVDLALDHLKRAESAGYGDLDWTAMSTSLRADAGLPLPEKKK